MGSVVDVAVKSGDGVAYIHGRAEMQMEHAPESWLLMPFLIAQRKYL